MHRHGYIGRKKCLPELQEEPAIIIAAFGSSRRGATSLSFFVEHLKKTIPDYRVFWAYSSQVIRRKTGLPSLHQALSEAEAAGYRKIVVQPLHIFPGTEYQQIAETCEYFPGLRVFLGETLMHRWEFIHQTLEVIAGEFLPDEHGLNVLALHGTPLAIDPANIAYLGLEKLVTDLYDNVVAASIEGIPSFACLCRRLRRTQARADRRMIKIIPLMYFSGVHVEKDLMGSHDSWKCAFESLGFDVSCATAEHQGENHFKGLAFYPEILGLLTERLERTLALARYY